VAPVKKSRARFSKWAGYDEICHPQRRRAANLSVVAAANRIFPTKTVTSKAKSAWHGSWICQAYRHAEAGNKTGRK